MKVSDQTIIDVITQNSLKDQSEVVEALAKRDVTITQASLSRRLKKLNVNKANGFYKVSSTLDQQLLTYLIVEVKKAPPNLIVIRTKPGCANTFAAQLDEIIDSKSEDNAMLPYSGMLGTIAGDDTIFVAVESAKHLDNLYQQIAILI